MNIDVRVWLIKFDRASHELDEFNVWKWKSPKDGKILVENYFMSSSEMAPWKYSLVKIKPDLRLPSKFPTYFKSHQSVSQGIWSKKSYIDSFNDLRK